MNIGDVFGGVVMVCGGQYLPKTIRRSINAHIYLLPSASDGYDSMHNKMDTGVGSVYIVGIFWMMLNYIYTHTHIQMSSANPWWVCESDVTFKSGGANDEEVQENVNKYNNINTNIADIERTVELESTQWDNAEGEREKRDTEIENTQHACAPNLV